MRICKEMDGDGDGDEHGVVRVEGSDVYMEFWEVGDVNKWLWVVEGVCR